ncbi:MAG: GNAT family N-acetyltransferase [Eubacteriales bacterium]|nr:GNAT family N-acetyltransferase [Eubacteriales bacterium]
MKVRLATQEDRDFLLQWDHHLPPKQLAEKLRCGQIYILEDEAAARQGWLRYGLFWDEIPFMNLLWVMDGHRGEGWGRALVERWEADCRDAGYDRVMTSTQSNEDSQHFYRHLGYVDTGALLQSGEPLEIILAKEL